MGLVNSPLATFASTSDTLTILYTNDWHSRIDPFPENHTRYPGLGGASRRAVLIEEIRKTHDHVLLLDAGDIFQGTPYFNLFGGELEFKLMSAMKYDAVTLGNHDFDAGIDGLVNQMQYASFEFLNANYDFGSTPLKDHVKPYRIFEKGPFRVGVFGIGIELDGLVPDAHHKGVLYQDPIDIANDYARHLKKKKCDLVICLSHLGYKYRSEKISDVILAEKTENIDLIIGGHTHTFLEKPVLKKNISGKNVAIVQTGWAGLNLGKIDFKADTILTAENAHSTMLKIC